MKKAFLSASMISVAILGGCGDSDSGSSTSAPMPDGVVKTLAELEKCNSSTKGEVVQVLADGSFYRCENNEWIDLGWEKEITPSSSSAAEKDVSSSSKKPVFNEKDAIETPKSSSSKVVESSSSEDIEESSSSVIDDESSSSEAPVQSSSSSKIVESSSSSKIESSSSSKIESSSSSEEESSSSETPVPDPTESSSSSAEPDDI